MLSKSIVRIIPALALLSVLGMSNVAFANSQAKFKNIERQLNTCANQARSAGGHNSCIADALNKYERSFTNSQKSQYRKHKNMCTAKFGDPSYLSEAEASEPLDCMHKAAKAVARKK